MVEGVPWTVDEYFEREEAEKGGDGGLGVTQCTKSTLVCLDNMEHEHTTAHLVTVEAEKLGLSDHLQFVVADAFDILDAPTPPRAGATPDPPHRPRATPRTTFVSSLTKMKAEGQS